MILHGTRPPIELDERGQVVDRREVLERARRSGALRQEKRTAAVSPTPKKWFEKYLDGGHNPDRYDVGVERVIVAAGVRKHVCQQLGIPEPKMRFFSANAMDCGLRVEPGNVGCIGQYQHDNNLIFVASGRSLGETALIVAHECAHAQFGGVYGDVRWLTREEHRLDEQRAAASGEDVIEFLERRVCGGKWDDAAVWEWSRDVLYHARTGRGNLAAAANGRHDLAGRERVLPPSPVPSGTNEGR